jgi:site-specific DNA-methyltransferase (adenine-specific)
MNNFISEVTNEDCMEGMARYPDNYFDLAIVDPPYGIGEDGGKCRTRGSKKTNGVKKNWDNKKPTNEYWKELFRVSNNQIVWGGNYYTDKLPVSRCWIYWQKELGGDFSDGELAWTSFDKVMRQYKKRSETFNRIHPTQKPIALYKWLLHNYAKQGDKILDTHLGSGSSRIAAYDMGFDFTAFELDKEYFEAQEKRYKAHIAQLKLDLL